MKYPKPYADSTLKRKYRELPLSAETVALLHKYLDAMNNLYMIIPLKKAYEIIMSQNPDLDMSEETFGAFTALVRREDHPYYILEEDDLLGEETEESDHDRFLAHECLFLYSDDDFYVLAEQQTGKPYYIPDREIFLSYADDFYYEPNPSYDKFKTFLRKELKETDEQRIEDILFEVIIAIENDNEQNPIQLIQSVLDDMERIKVFFSNEKQVETFISLFMELSNHTHLPSNRGFTPVQLQQIMPAQKRVPKSMIFGPGIEKSLKNREIDPDELRRTIKTMQLPNESLRRSMLDEVDRISGSVKKNRAVPKKVKIGRNDPCPCGSGKKYKNCCGKFVN